MAHLKYSSDSKDEFFSLLQIGLLNLIRDIALKKNTRIIAANLN